MTEAIISGIFWVLAIVGAVGAVFALVSLIRAGGDYKKN